MHDVPSWVETLRGVILLIVWTVLAVRLPALRRSSHRPVWAVLFMLAGGALAIQAPVGHWIDRTTQIPAAAELAVALVALTDFATVWWFAVALHGAGHRTPTWLRRAPLACAATMAALAVLFFALTPAHDRFGAQAHGWWVGYAIAWSSYGLITAVGAAALFWWHGVTMRSAVLRLSMLALAVGCTAEVPYQVIRAVRWFDPHASPTLTLAGFWCSFARFVLVALGCSLAALEPLRKAVLYRYRRQRLHALWLLLREATPELVLTAPQARLAELLTPGDAWEHLHQRVIDIRDSIAYLHDGWASPQLLTRAAGHAAAAGGGQPLAMACWIEVTRRQALADEPKLHEELGELGEELLPQTDASQSTVQHEVRRLLELHRALRSEPVRAFADRTDHPSAEPSAF
ncbi:hypothetical protein GCM10009665_04800 [Kitasatospora nipponensis]|uniref:DUF6545 domain-containing protein n=1 Tax=Kitasatospora nipponensis TaxID=258049 RepID=A0ABP4GD66_9ACTN